jgi:hypothetical protein
MDKVRYFNIPECFTASSGHFYISHNSAYKRAHFNVFHSFIKLQLYVNSSIIFFVLLTLQDESSYVT